MARIRGGAYSLSSHDARCAVVYHLDLDVGIDAVGFRLVHAPGEDGA